MAFHQGSSDGFALRVLMILLFALHADSQGHFPVLVMQICYF